MLKFDASSSFKLGKTFSIFVVLKNVESWRINGTPSKLSNNKQNLENIYMVKGNTNFVNFTKTTHTNVEYILNRY